MAGVGGHRPPQGASGLSAASKASLPGPEEPGLGPSGQRGASSVVWGTGSLCPFLSVPSQHLCGPVRCVSALVFLNLYLSSAASALSLFVPSPG